MIFRIRPKTVAFPYAGRITMAFLDGRAKVVDAVSVRKAWAKELEAPSGTYTKG